MLKLIGIRSGAILAGWLIYNLPIVTYYILFNSYFSVHSTLSFMLWTTLYNMLFAFLGTFFAAIIATNWEKAVSLTLAILIGFYGFISLLFSGLKVPLWYQLVLICLVPPVAYYGGVVRLKILEMD